MLIWIIDEEWSDYDLEHEVLEKEFPGVEIKCSTYDCMEDLEKFGKKADGILAQVYADMPRKLIEKLENCKGIAVYGGGYDRIDIEACREKGIKVTNIQDYCSEDLADYVMAAMFMVNKKLVNYSSRVKEDVKAGKWGALAVDNQVHRLSAQKLLIVGFGAIGKVVTKKAQGLGIEVIAYDEYLDEAEIAKYGVKKVGWAEGFKEADFVSIHLKGVDANANKIGMNEFRMMKETAYVINTARGKIIVEEDLIKAVKEKEIAGAILDVIKTEPPKPDDPMLSCPGIYVTPHVSYISEESFKALKEYALGNLMAMIRGEKPRNPVV